jgi:cyclopropane fatty-acyl-phospholipid synthase-like methyltransferase
VTRDYAAIAEEHAARAVSPLAAVGSADAQRFAQLGRIQLALLKAEGLQPSSRLLEFGCNAGRLALQAIPYLASGRYLGLDFSPTLVRYARDTVDALLSHADPGRFQFGADSGENLGRWLSSFDMACAFSVFPHMEHEDTLRLLRQFASVLVPGGRMVCSVIALETELGKLTMLAEADIGPSARWSRMRNVATTCSMMETVASFAGFQNFRWYKGDAFKVRLDDGTLDGFRQSVLAAEKR